MVDDTELLESCFIALRQLIIGNKEELLKVNEGVLLFVDKTLGEILQKLDGLLPAGKKHDLLEYSLKARKALSNLLHACVSCLLWSNMKHGTNFTEEQVKKELKKIEQKHPKLRQRLKELRMAKKSDGVAEAFDNDLDSVCIPQRLKRFHDEPSSSYIDVMHETEEKTAKTRGGIAEWSKNVDSEMTRHIRAVNHKFETWKTIMSEEMLFDKQPNGKLMSLRGALPGTLFYGERAHDLGQILMSEESEGYPEDLRKRIGR